MSIPLVVNGATFNYPVTFDEGWGPDATGWAQAVTNGMLQRAGGNFPLLADANFGATFGLISAYYKSTSANLATAGAIRLSNTDTLDWRNFANTADLPLGVNAANQLTFNGSALAFTGAVNSGTQYQLAYYATTGTSVSGDSSITTNVNNQLVVQDGTTSLPAYTFQMDATSGMYGGPNLVALACHATTVLSFNDTQGTLSVPLNMGTNKIINLVDGSGIHDAAAFGQITAANAGALPITGGTLSGNIAMGGNKITGLADGTAPSDAATFGQVSAVGAPTGAIIMYGAASAPTGWLLCDGTSYATASFTALFAVIGYTFGGVGANFNVPNMVNNVPIGAGSTAALGATAGAPTASDTETILQAPHHHETTMGHLGTTSYTDNTSPYGVSSRTTTIQEFATAGAGPIAENFDLTSAVTAINAPVTVTVSTIQPSLGLTYIIKT